MAGDIITDQNHSQRCMRAAYGEVFDTLRFVQQQRAGNSLAINLLR